MGTGEHCEANEVKIKRNSEDIQDILGDLITIRKDLGSVRVDIAKIVSGFTLLGVIINGAIQAYKG